MKNKYILQAFNQHGKSLGYWARGYNWSWGPDYAAHKVDKKTAIKARGQLNHLIGHGEYVEILRIKNE